MEFEIDRAAFLDGLKSAQGVVERRNTLPILSNVLIESSASGITILATDLDIGVRRNCNADVRGTGALTVNARKLLDVVKELPGERVRLRGLDNHRVEIVAGRARLNLVGLDPKEFPSIPGLTGKPGKAATEVTVPTAVLGAMIDSTLFAVSSDETRINLSGVFVENHQGMLRMVATDGHRLALIDRKVEGKVPEKGAILPRKGLYEAKRILEEGVGEQDEATLSIDGSIAKITQRGSELVMRLIEGEFPDYRQVIPKSSKATLGLSRADFLHAIGCVWVLSNERAKGIRVSLKPGVLEVQANNPDVGDGSYETEVVYSGDELSIGFNGRYLMDALTAMREGERVEFMVSDDVSPGVLRPEGDETYCYVVMPMRL